MLIKCGQLWEEFERDWCSLNVCFKVKPSGSGLFFVRRFLITDSISLLVLDLFICSASLWFSLSRFLGICLFHPVNPIYWLTHVQVLPYNLSFISDFSNLSLPLFFFGFPKICQFFHIFININLILLIFCVAFLYCIYFCFNLLFPFSCFVFSFLFSSFLQGKVRLLISDLL